MTEHHEHQPEPHDHDDRRHDQHDDQRHARRREPATYDEQESRVGRSFPLLAPVIVAITAGIILLVFVVFGPGR